MSIEEEGAQSAENGRAPTIYAVPETTSPTAATKNEGREKIK
jgi:hypothetical protein